MQSERATARTILRALGIGLVGGMRSWTAPAAVALTYDTAPDNSGWRRWPVFSTKGARLAWLTLGAVEYVADKWPRTIPRIRLKPQPTHTDGGLLGRSAVASLAGAAIGSEQGAKGSVALGAALSGAAAIASNYFFYYLRKAVVKKSRLHDYTVAMIEDQIALALAIIVARTGSRLRSPSEARSLV